MAHNGAFGDPELSDDAQVGRDGHGRRRALVPKLLALQAFHRQPQPASRHQCRSTMVTFRNHGPNVTLYLENFARSGTELVRAS